MKPLAQNLRAGALIALAMALYAVSDAFLKQLSTRVPVGEIMGLRGLMMTALLYALLSRQGHRYSPTVWLQPWNIARGAIEVGCGGLYFLALANLPLGDTATLFFIAPVMLTALAALILKEPVGPRRWAAVLCGFLGVVITAGTPQSWTLLILLPLGSALFSALRDIATRQISPFVPAGAISLVTAACMTVGGFLTLPFGWVVPDASALLVLSGSALVVAGGYQSYVHAIRLGDLSFVSPIRYVAVPIAMILGFIGWGDVPTPMKMVGACVIVGSGLFIFYRERRLSQEAPT
jgi:drug/metabolite transporter (DMT)-like permease